MVYKLFDYVDAQGRNVVKEWTAALQKPQRAKLNQLLDKLVMHGDDLYPQMLTGTDIPGIHPETARSRERSVASLAVQRPHKSGRGIHPSAGCKGNWR